MNIQKENIKKEFWDWAKTENPRLVENAELGDVYAIQNLDHMFMGFAAAKARAIPDGFVLVDEDTIEDIQDSFSLLQEDIAVHRDYGTEHTARRDFNEILERVTKLKAMIEAAQEQDYE